MKKIKYVLALILTVLIFPLNVNAASGKISVTGTSSAVVGNTVTVTVTLSSSTKIGSWDMDLKYDKSYLQLISANSEAGGVSMVNSSSGTKSKSYTFKFKTLKKGNTTVGMSSYTAYAYDDMSEMSLSAGSKNIKIMTQAELEASYSKDNNLKSLSVENFEITPEFNKDTLEYSVVVPEDTKEIKINAKENDSKASVSGAGVKEVTSGTNVFEITVRAENGSEKTYKITVEVKDSNPINVTIDNKEYTVVKLKENLPAASFYSEYTVKINDFEIPAYKNDHTKVVLIGLKDIDGNITLFKYDENTNKYSKYFEVGTNKITVIPTSTSRDVPGYTKTKVKVGDIEVDGYTYNDSSKFALIYGMNAETGEEGLYLYDKDNQAILKYNDEYINVLQDRLNLYTYIIIGFSGILVLMFIILIAATRKKRKKSKKEVIAEPVEEIKKVEEKEDSNEIVEITSDEAPNEEAIEEKSKKKKNKKK